MEINVLIISIALLVISVILFYIDYRCNRRKEMRGDVDTVYGPCTLWGVLSIPAMLMGIVMLAVYLSNIVYG